MDTAAIIFHEFERTVDKYANMLIFDRDRILNLILIARLLLSII